MAADIKLPRLTSIVVIMALNIRIMQTNLPARPMTTRTIDAGHRLLALQP